MIKQNASYDVKYTPIWDIQSINRLHKQYGISIYYLLSEFNLNPSSYYYKTRFSLEVGNKKSRVVKPRGFCYTITGEKVPDEFVIDKLKEIKSNINALDENSYVKVMGSEKLCEFFRKKYGIIINHKKMNRLKHEIGLVGKYTNHPPHPRRRPKEHVATAPNQYWEMDIKYFKVSNRYIQAFSIIDTFDRKIVATYINYSCKSIDVIKTIYQALRYRKIDGKKLIIRSDNGTQFTSKVTETFMLNVGITHEFGYPHNPDCQAFIESFHASVQREFVPLNTFTSITDFIMKYKVYLKFYHDVRPHGSLKYMTPNEFGEFYEKNHPKTEENKEKEIILEKK